MHTEFRVLRRADHTYYVPDHVGDTIKIVESEVASIEFLSLDELLSPRALFILNERGYVNFKIRQPGVEISGRISRSRTIPEVNENIVVAAL